jgi:hypothetical protein
MSHLLTVSLLHEKYIKKRTQKKDHPKIPYFLPKTTYFLAKNT